MQQKYKKLMSAPILQYVQHISWECFAYIQQRKNFALLVLYTQDGKVYMDYANDIYSFPAIWSDSKQDFYRLISNYLAKHNISSLQQNIIPIAFCENTYISGKANHVVHGVVYAIQIPEESIFCSPKNPIRCCIPMKQEHCDRSFVALTDLIDCKIKHSQKGVLTYIFSSFKNTYGNKSTYIFGCAAWYNKI